MFIVKMLRKVLLVSIKNGIRKKKRQERCVKAADVVKNDSLFWIVRMSGGVEDVSDNLCWKR